MGGLLGSTLFEFPLIGFVGLTVVVVEHVYLVWVGCLLLFCVLLSSLANLVVADAVSKSIMQLLLTVLSCLCCTEN